MLGSGLRAFMGSFIGDRAYQNGTAGLLAAIYTAVYQLTVHAQLWEAAGRPTGSDAVVKRWGRRLERVASGGLLLHRAKQRLARHR
jgi:hypothetical protein